MPRITPGEVAETSQGQCPVRPATGLARSLVLVLLEPQHSATSRAATDRRSQRRERRRLGRTPTEAVFRNVWRRRAILVAPSDERTYTVEERRVTYCRNRCCCEASPPLQGEGVIRVGDIPCP